MKIDENSDHNIDPLSAHEPNVSGVRAKEQKSVHGSLKQEVES
jgi:hypothetical protein